MVSIQGELHVAVRRILEHAVEIIQDPTWYGYRHFEAGLHVIVFAQAAVFVDKLQPRYRAHATHHEGETPGWVWEIEHGRWAKAVVVVVWGWRKP